MGPLYKNASTWIHWAALYLGLGAATMSCLYSQCMDGLCWSLQALGKGVLVWVAAMELNLPQQGHIPNTEFVYV